MRPFLSQLAIPPTLSLNAVHPRKAKEVAIWREGLTQAAQQLRGVLPKGSAFLLIDDVTVGGAFEGCGRAIPFPQKNGIYEGPPANSRGAIAEMKTHRALANYVVIFESASWWLTYYSEWSE